MEVRSRIPRAPPADPGDTGEEEEDADEEAFAEDQEQLMVFDVVMQVVEGDKAGRGMGASGKRNSAGDWSFVPLLVKLKQVHGSTVTMSSSAVAALLGNDTSVAVPTGYESYDFGVAGQAPDEQ
eukprot:1144409-Pelagomonas_calceolata.AAC.1